MLKSSYFQIVVMLFGLFGLNASLSGQIEDPIPEPISQGDIHVSLDTIATGLTAPNWGGIATNCPELADYLYVSDQSGDLWQINTITGDKSSILDVEPWLVELGIVGSGTFDERGLIGVAFSPRYSRDGLIYTYTSEPVDGAADFSTMPPDSIPNHQSVIREWNVPDPCNPASVVDVASTRVLLRIDEPQFNHDGGSLAFGKDRLLYIALGDGGGADDEGLGHGDDGNGQNINNVLGKILRINPRGNNSANGNYGIPADNPFVGQEGIDEIYVYGLRNPFRFSFDKRTGEMYIADVGQNDIEEVNIGTSGGNYGWPLREGTFCFDGNGDEAGFVFDCPADPDMIDPIAQYDHDEGTAIIGGFVYYGRSIPELRGRYVFGEWSQVFFANNGRLFYLDDSNTIQEFQIDGQADAGMSVQGFGQDRRGEVYVMGNLTGTPFGETGVVLRLAAGTAASMPGNQVAVTAERFSLEQNYPNPFNPSTQINFQIPLDSEVKLVVYDLLGRVVKTLAKGSLAAGEHTAEWDGRNQLGQAVSSGVYIYRLNAGDFVQTRKMLLSR